MPDNGTLQAVGHRVAILRNERKLTQKQLAKMIGVEERTLSRWETGASAGIFDGDQLECTARALEVDPAQITGPPADPPPSEVRDELRRLGRKVDRLAAAVRDLR